MQTRVDKRVFERTDFGAFGWIKEGPITPPYQTAFFASTQDATKSFRVGGDIKRVSQTDTDFGSFAWIFTSTIFDPVEFVATNSMTQSFRVGGDIKRVLQTDTDFGSFGWLNEGPDTPAYLTEFFASTQDATESFRVGGDIKRVLQTDTDFGSFGWVFTVTVLDPVEFVAASSMTQSFRVGERPRYDLRLTDFGSFGWLNEGPDTPIYLTEFFSAIDSQLRKAFRLSKADERKLIDLRLTDFGSMGWLKTGSDSPPVSLVNFMRSMRMAIEYEGILEVVSPSDTEDLSKKGILYIGSAGDVVVDGAKSGTQIKLVGVPAGTWLNFIRVRRVYSTGTTATNIVLAR